MTAMNILTISLASLFLLVIAPLALFRISRLGFMQRALSGMLSLWIGFFLLVTLRDYTLMPNALSRALDAYLNLLSQEHALFGSPVMLLLPLAFFVFGIYLLKRKESDTHDKLY